VPADLERELAERRDEVQALAERLALARGRLSNTVARNREIRALRKATTAKRPAWVDSDDALADARRAATEMDDHRAALALLADRRARAVRRAMGGGLSCSDVARSLGVTRQAISKLLRAFPAEK
jgi:DNA-directed RNA polymerase specialized sigma24 family protein